MKNINLACDLISENKFEEAKSILEEIIKEEPQNKEAIKNLGLCQINLGEWDGAKITFEKATIIDPDDATSWFYLASSAEKISEISIAIEGYKKVISLRPEFYDAIKHNNGDAGILENNFGKIMFNHQKTLDTILSLKSRDGLIYNKPIDNYGSPFIHAFAEVLPNEQNQKDYQKALQILRSTPKIDYNLRDAMGTSFLEKILNSENEQLLDVVKDFEFTYTPEIDYVYRNISTPEFKELVDKNVKVKFIDLEESIKFENKEAVDKTISCLKSPFAKPKKVLDDLMPIIAEIKDGDFRYYVLSKFFEITSSNNEL